MCARNHVAHPLAFLKKKQPDFEKRVRSNVFSDDNVINAHDDDDDTIYFSVLKGTI